MMYRDAITRPERPQDNGRVEKKFALAKAHAYLHAQGRDISLGEVDRVMSYQSEISKFEDWIVRAKVKLLDGGDPCVQLEDVAKGIEVVHADVFYEKLWEIAQAEREDMWVEKGMTLNEYQNRAGDTDMLLSHTYYREGLSGEAGEVSQIGKRSERDGTEPEDSKEAYLKEYGDVLWYLARGAAKLGLTLEEVALANLEKLKSRKERGKIQGKGDNR